MRLLLFLISSSTLFSLIEASCCTPECCCAGCTTCTNPVTDRCNSYSCTTYAGANGLGGNCGSYSTGWRSGSTAVIQYNTGAYSGGGGTVRGYNEYQRLSPSMGVAQSVAYHTAQGQPIAAAGCKCGGQQQPIVTAPCICPDNTIQHQGTVVSTFNGIGGRVLHKDTCYGYDYCLLGLPGWVTIICSILLLLIFIILLFYCISCLVHLFII